MEHPMTIQDDGISLSAVLETPEGGESRRLAVLLHGFGSAGDRVHTVQAAAAMREAGFATLRFDLYGHGKSGGDFRRHTLYRWISNTLAVTRYARELGYTEIVLSGHSQGGLVAALAAGMEPDRVCGLVLRAPAFMIPRGAREGLLLGFPFDPDRIPDEIPLPQGVTLDGDYIRVAQTLYPEETAARFRGPVLSLHGEEDDVVPPADSRAMAWRYADCELDLIPGETHHFDKRPEEMRSLIRAFMTKLTDTDADGRKGREEP